MENLKSLEDLLFLFLQQTKLSKFVEPEDLNTLRRRISGEGITFLTTTLPRLDKWMLAKFRSPNSDWTESFNLLKPDLVARTACKRRPYNGKRKGKPLFLSYCTNVQRYVYRLDQAVKFYRRENPFACRGGGAVSATEPEGLPLGFKASKLGNYPCLFQRAWAHILEKDGSLRSPADIDADAVMLIRQVSNLFYKLELPYTVAQIGATISSFKQAEVDVSGFSQTFDIDAERANILMLARARRFVCRLLADVDPSDALPRHGSGSSACGVKPHKRYESFRFIPRLNEVFPYDKYFFYSHTHLSDELDKLLSAEEAEPPAKVVLVPKDSRGPRLISEEPREFMFIQQGLMKLLYGRVENIPAIAGQIGFTDQTRNQDLAWRGSLTGEFATLDLKEASDRVSWKLVSYLFPENWVTALRASRSLATVLPDGEILRLNKFAPMGSACCFPVEAICFWAIALAAMGCDAAYRNRLFNSQLLGDDITMSVFGDDIIVPSQHAERVRLALTSVGLLVNESKSYSAGPFRESCGGDYLLGIDVTPLRCKAVPNLNDKRSIFRTVELLNNVIRRFGVDSVGYSCFRYLKDSVGIEVPVSNRYVDDSLDKSKTSTGLYLLGRVTDVPSTYRRRWNSDLQKVEYRIPCMQAHNFVVDLDGWSHVLRKELLSLSETRADLIALPKRYRIKYRWTEL